MYAEWIKKGFNLGSPKASCDPVGHILTAGRTVEPGAKPAIMPRGTKIRAPYVAAGAALRGKLPQYGYASSCTARAGAAVRSIASEESAVALAAQIYVWSHSRIFWRYFRSYDQSNLNMTYQWRLEKSVVRERKGSFEAASKRSPKSAKHSN